MFVFLLLYSVTTGGFMDIEKLDISSMIYEIRGKQVMLDSDLAKLYECTNGTKEVNQAVKNNIRQKN